MKIDYSKILKKNMINVFKDILLSIEKNGFQEGHHLYVNINTKNKKVIIPKWLKDKSPEEITIIIQYEFWNLGVKNYEFSICLSFNDIKANLTIPYDSIISFADPYANFGLKLIQNNDIKKEKLKKKSISKEKRKVTNNIIDFDKYKKN